LNAAVEVEAGTPEAQQEAQQVVGVGEDSEILTVSEEQLEHGGGGEGSLFVWSKEGHDKVELHFVNV
jgi:hypothetical protein